MLPDTQSFPLELGYKWKNYICVVLYMDRSKSFDVPGFSCVIAVYLADM